MKVYTVMQGPCEDKQSEFSFEACLIQAADPSVHDDLESAVTEAKNLARTFPGRQVWIVEGEAVKSFYVPLAQVEEVEPTVGDWN